MEAQGEARIQRQGDPRTGKLTVKRDGQTDGGCFVVDMHLTILPCDIHAVREKREWRVISPEHGRFTSRRDPSPPICLSSSSKNTGRIALWQARFPAQGAIGVCMTLDGASAKWFAKICRILPKKELARSRHPVFPRKRPLHGPIHIELSGWRTGPRPQRKTPVNNH